MSYIRLFGSTKEAMRAGNRGGKWLLLAETQRRY